MKGYKNWYTFIIILVLIINIALAVAVRTSHVKSLQGKYLVDYDAYLYYYQAKIIIKNGKLPERDNMRYVPIGIQANQRANLNSYAIAYFYKVVRLFMPKITLEQAAIAYPVVCLAIALIVFTLLVNRLFSRAMALLSVTILATVPALVFRTMAGYADRDALELLEMFLIFYFYVWANQTKNVRNQLLLSAISGIITGILALTWPGVGIVMAVIVLYNLAKLLMGEYGKRGLYLYISWYIPAIFMSVALTRVYTDVSQPYVMLAVFVPTAFLSIAIATVATCGHDMLSKKLSLSNRVPIGFAVSILALLIFTTLIGLVSGPTTVARSIHKVGESFLYPIFGDIPLAKSVVELKRMNILDWWSAYKGFLFVFMLGAIVSVWKLAREYNLSWKLLTSSLTVMLATTIISSMSKKPPLDGHTILSNIIYVIPILTFFGLTCALYLQSNRHRDIQEKPFDNLIFTLVWFTALFFCTRAAMRFDFLFAPAAVILGSYAIIEFLKILGKGDLRLTEKLVVYMVITILCWETLAFGNIFSFTFSAVSFSKIKASLSTRINLNITLVIMILLFWLGAKSLSDGRRAFHIKRALFVVLVCILAVILGGSPWTRGYVLAKQRVPIPSEKWVKVIDWMKKNTAEDAVFALWWDYGNRILALAERATIVDNEQISYQVHLQARHIFLAQSEREALEFLYTHKATHLLINSMDIDIINTISGISATEQFDRQTSVYYLRGDKSGLHFSPDSNAKSIKSVDLVLNPDGNPKSAVINVTGEQIKLMPKLASTARQTYVFSDDRLKGCVVVTPVEVIDCGCEESGNENKKRWTAIYLDEIAKNSLVMKLYLLEENSPHFVLVYPPKSETLQDNLSTGDIKIWKINYPGGIKANPEYLLTKPPK